LACLAQNFGDEQASAPVRAANFVLGPPVQDESEDIRFRRLQKSNKTWSTLALCREPRQKAVEPGFQSF
jgi:hypothetical protein